MTKTRFFMKKLRDNNPYFCTHCQLAKRPDFRVQDNFGRIYFYYCVDCSQGVTEDIAWEDGAEVSEEWVMCDHGDDASCMQVHG